jgi:hypothetical protein
VLDEFLDTVAMTQRVGVAINQSRKENHSIRVYRFGLLALGKIGSTTYECNGSILDPDGLAFDKLSGKRIEESPIDENGIRGSVPGNYFMTHHRLTHLFHTQRITKDTIGFKIITPIEEVLRNFLNRIQVKLPAHRARLPGKEISFILCPLTPPTRRGLRGTFRSKGQ